jgi:hypothetical protein
MPAVRVMLRGLPPATGAPELEEVLEFVFPNLGERPSLVYFEAGSRK